MVLIELLRHAELNGIQKLIGVYKPTEKNKMVEEHYPNLGFVKVAADPDGSTTWELEVKNATVQGSPMKVRSLGFELVGA
jgi:predicted enzyme involved in methoxymalonyl-ACP biosynthesis